MQELINKIKPKELEIVGTPRSNWRVKIYPKPTLWVSKETLKGIKTKKKKKHGIK